MRTNAVLVYCELSENPLTHYYFSSQITKKRAWGSTSNTLIGSWMEWLVRGKEIFSEKVVRFVLSR